MTLRILDQLPDLRDLILQNNPLADSLRTVPQRDPATRWRYFLALAFLPAVCEELAFRGFILSGLRTRFRPWTAILLSSFLFALSHMNVFQFLPSFLLGMVLGILAVRSASVLPGMLLHLLYNALLISPVLLSGLLDKRVDLQAFASLRLLIAVFCALLAAPVLWRLASRMWTVEQPVPQGPVPEWEPSAEAESMETTSSS
jgi:membrane protease YdiL (CAAX protease family)